MRSSGIAAAAVLALAATATAAQAAATEVKCRRADEVRRIEIVLAPDPGLLCEVRYAKSERGPDGSVLWIAKHDRAFCHDRADQLISRLAERGWVCDVMPKRRGADGTIDEAGPGITDRMAEEARPSITVPRPPR